MSFPVWNKSYREHAIIGSKPESARRAADSAVRELAWAGPYHTDADHINLNTVGGFLNWCDFYTIDVADAIGHSRTRRLPRLLPRAIPNLPGASRSLESASRSRRRAILSPPSPSSTCPP